MKTIDEVNNDYIVRSENMYNQIEELNKSKNDIVIGMRKKLNDLEIKRAEIINYADAQQRDLKNRIDDLRLELGLLREVYSSGKRNLLDLKKERSEK
jgi:hypothetical protein